MGRLRGPWAPAFLHRNPGGQGEAAPRPCTSSRCCPGFASLHDTLSLAVMLVTGISRQSGNETGVQGRGGAQPRLSILPAAAGSGVAPGLSPLSILLELQAAGSPPAASLPEHGSMPQRLGVGAEPCLVAHPNTAGT